MYDRIAVEMKNKVRLEKNLISQKKKEDLAEKERKKVIAARRKEEEAREAQRQLDTEVKHQKEEAEARALGRAMLTDSALNRPSFNHSCLNVLNSYQGIKNIIYIVTELSLT